MFKLFSNLQMQNINKKQEYLCFAYVSSYIGVWAKPTLFLVIFVVCVAVEGKIFESKWRYE